MFPAKLFEDCDNRFTCGVVMTSRRTCGWRIRLPADSVIPVNGRAGTVRISSAADGFTRQLTRDWADNVRDHDGLFLSLCPSARFPCESYISRKYNNGSSCDLLGNVV